MAFSPRHSYQIFAIVDLGEFVPVVKGLDGTMRDLTAEESKVIGYDFHEARRI